MDHNLCTEHYLADSVKDNVDGQQPLCWALPWRLCQRQCWWTATSLLSITLPTLSKTMLMDSNLSAEHYLADSVKDNADGQQPLCWALPCRLCQRQCWWTATSLLSITLPTLSKTMLMDSNLSADHYLSDSIKDNVNGPQPLCWALPFRLYQRQC
jgi:uncharacterized protein YfaA (DUF2138 family)